MPEMDGYRATAEIRRREAGGHRSPIIAMTANALEGDREKALEAGMDDYVPKPVKPEELDATLKRWISGPAPAQDEGAPDVAGNGVGEPLDADVVASLRESGEPGLLSELAAMFFDDASSHLGDLREAVAAGDAPAVERTAHTLKGSSGMMGAREMAATCSDLQELGESGDLSGAPELLGRLEEEFGRVRPALEAEVEGDAR